jgi:hypothetical protein
MSNAIRVLNTLPLFKNAVAKDQSSTSTHLGTQNRGSVGFHLVHVGQTREGRRLVAVAGGRPTFRATFYWSPCTTHMYYQPYRS